MKHNQMIVGQKTNISETLQLIFLNKASKLIIGDYCNIGDNVKIIVTDSNVFIDDWTSIHDNCLLLCKNGLHIGQHCWFGQNTILDGTGGLRIGNSVRVGMYSQIWSHVAAGEQYDGCTLHGERPTTISDGAWLVGSCIVSSGVHIGHRVVALIGSNIVDPIPDNTVVAGIPAKPKKGVSFYQEISFDKKVKLLTDWLHEFKMIYDHTEINTDTKHIVEIKNKSDTIKFFLISEDFDKHIRLGANNESNVTLVDLRKKLYSKAFTALEHRLFKFLSSNKVRFLKYNF